MFKVMIGFLILLSFNSAFAIDKLMRPQGGAGILYFYADWCEHCQRNQPYINQILKQNPKLHIEKLNIDTNAEDAQYFGIKSVPSMCLVIRKPMTKGEYSLDYQCDTVDSSNMQYFVNKLKEIDF